MGFFSRREPHKDLVKCEECKHYIDKKDAQEIPVKHYLDEPHPWYCDYYCPEHRRNYSTEVRGRGAYTSTYHAMLRVDEDGTPIGYIKAPKKK